MWKTLAYDGQRGLALAPEPATKMQGFIFLTGTLETRERGLDALKQQRLFSGLKFQQVALGVEIDILSRIGLHRILIISVTS